MNINRDNYEEFFLLYADNELPADQRRCVEDFVKQNPDLKEELNFLKELHLDPDPTLVFSHKESLLQPISGKEEATLITEEDEKILRYLDQELSAAETSELKQRISHSPDLQSRLEIFSKTKIQPDLSVTFPDKSVLYRNTAGKVRVFQMNWVRIAVAAAILLIAGLLWINNSVEETTGNGTLAGITDRPEERNNSIEDANQPVEPKVSDNAETPASATELTLEQQQVAASASTPDINTVRVKSSSDKQLIQKAGPVEENQQVLASLEKTERQQEILTTTGNEQALVNVSPNQGRELGIIDRPMMDANVKSDYATEALMSSQDAVEVVAVENNSNRKGPFRGIVRKANRIFSKVTNPDMDKPTVRVANFEIALAN